MRSTTGDGQFIFVRSEVHSMIAIAIGTSGLRQPLLESVLTRQGLSGL